MTVFVKPLGRIAVTALLAAVALSATACRRRDAAPASAASGAPALPSAASGDLAAPSTEPPNDTAAKAGEGPRIASTVIAATIYKLPDTASRKVGYVRLGGSVRRDAEPVEGNGCKHQFFHVYPVGYVCTDEATTDLSAPLVRAASVGPDRSRPMPYRYGFVRATAPLYLRVPTHDEQEKSEFQLAEHLSWFDEHKLEVQRVELGANDVPLDSQGFPRIGLPLPPGQRLSPSLEQNELFGGKADEALPWWLDGGRKVPNVSGFDVPEYAVFADRVRRKTGLSFVNGFVAKDNGFERRFGVTVDLRLVPATKVKPDTASIFHGTEVSDRLPTPFAFVNRRGVTAWKLIKNQDVAKATDAVPLRATFRYPAKPASNRATASIKRREIRHAGCRPTTLVS
jgi:hypothetical protein